MDGSWIQIRLRRTTRAALAEVGRNLCERLKLFPSNKANATLSPEETIGFLLSMYTGSLAKQKRKRKKT